MGPCLSTEGEDVVLTGEEGEGEGIEKIRGRSSQGRIESSCVIYSSFSPSVRPWQILHTLGKKTMVHH